MAPRAKEELRIRLETVIAGRRDLTRRKVRSGLSSDANKSAHTRARSSTALISHLHISPQRRRIFTNYSTPSLFAYAVAPLKSHCSLQLHHVFETQNQVEYMRVNVAAYSIECLTNLREAKNPMPSWNGRKESTLSLTAVPFSTVTVE